MPVSAARVRAGTPRADRAEAAAVGGGAVYLLTYTFRHHQGDDLADSVRKFQEARRKLKARRAYKRCMQDAGTVGTVSALEVTYGETTIDVDIDHAMKEALVEGIWDTTALMYSNKSKVESTVADLPYVQSD